MIYLREATLGYSGIRGGRKTDTVAKACLPCVGGIVDFTATAMKIGNTLNHEPCLPSERIVRAAKEESNGWISVRRVLGMWIHGS